MWKMNQVDSNLWPKLGINYDQREREKIITLIFFNAWIKNWYMQH